MVEVAREISLFLHFFIKWNLMKKEKNLEKKKENQGRFCRYNVGFAVNETVNETVKVSRKQRVSPEKFL
jgi:hypothetical protein